DLARQTLPLVHGVEGTAALGWAATPRDQVGCTLQATTSRFANGSKYIILDATGGWFTQLGRFTRGEASLGMSASSSEGPTGTEWAPGLLASAGVSQDVPLERQQLVAALHASISTTVDRFGAGVYQLAEATASVGYSPLRELRLSGTAGLSRALSGAG